MDRGAAQQRSIGIVMESSTGQRFAERLTRSGAVAHVITPEAFEQAARVGEMYLAPLRLAAPAAAVALRGAHVCLMPPWPMSHLAIGANAVGAVAVEQLSPTRATSALADALEGTTDAPKLMRILYRERLVGALSVPLVESASDEPLLATLPRASNRNGYLFVTTLQLSVASAQTRFDDVTRLVSYLLAWLRSHAEPVAHQSEQHGEVARQEDRAEEFAQIVLLALALALAAESPSATPATIPLERVRAQFTRVRNFMGIADDSSLFARGWNWLIAHNVASGSGQDDVLVQRDALERYSILWQLGPRLRRLRRIGGMS